jgi:hypothetical protein
MRRIWIGIGILVALLVTGVVAMQVMDRQLGTVTQKLEQASETKNWDEGVSLAQEAKKLWEEKWPMMAALSDHSDMDSVDELLRNWRSISSTGRKPITQPPAPGSARRLVT